ncbi:hypothetical protein VP01_389g4 [Puccinia sorghi]|uniref:Uncharacterized protein n=1 Tax=Puccinia sorghi TaxID=27349 RepID=A0A0L6USV6_9BASI|nr:hypothetical protein VP01_389g4 [Puccinia sorghi]
MKSLSHAPPTTSRTRMLNAKIVSQSQLQARHHPKRWRTPSRICWKRIQSSIHTSYRQKSDGGTDTRRITCLILPKFQLPIPIGRRVLLLIQLILDSLQVLAPRAENWTLKTWSYLSSTHTRADSAECCLDFYYVCRNKLLLALDVETKFLLSRTQGLDDYEDLEVCLFCIRAIQDGIPSDEMRCRYGLAPGHLLAFDWLALIPTTNYTASFSEWLKHCRSHVYSAPSTCQRSTQAFSRRKKSPGDEVAPLVELIRSTEGQVMPNECNKVLQAVTSVLQALPPKELVQPILSLMDPVITQLHLALWQHSQLQQLKACNQVLSGPDKKLLLLDVDVGFNAEKEKMTQLAQFEPIRNLQYNFCQLIFMALTQSIGDTIRPCRTMYIQKYSNNNLARSFYTPHNMHLECESDNQVLTFNFFGYCCLLTCGAELTSRSVEFTCGLRQRVR